VGVVVVVVVVVSDYFVCCVKTLLRRVVYLQLMPSELVRMRCQQLSGEHAADRSQQLYNNEQEKVHQLPIFLPIALTVTSV